MDPDIMMKAVGETAGARAKLYELVAKLFGPRITKKQTDANIYALERYTDFIRDNPDIEINIQGELYNAHSRMPNVLLARANQRQLNETIRQEENIEDVLGIANEELELAETASTEPIDTDWATRFFDDVKNVSNKEMKYIWGKILAGEIKKPGSYSLRTLEVVRNLSKQEAEAFQTVIPFVIRTTASFFIYNNLELLSELGCPFSSILTLKESGLLNYDNSIVFESQITEKRSSMFLCGKNAILVETALDGPIKYSIAAIPFTQAGRELFGIVDQTKNEKYTIEVARIIHNQCNSKG